MCYLSLPQNENSSPKFKTQSLTFSQRLVKRYENVLTSSRSLLQMALKQLSCDLQLFYPKSDFRLEFESMAIGNFEINDIIVAVERFIELATMIQNDDLSIKLAWQAYEYSLSAGKYSDPYLKNPFFFKN